MKGVEGAIYDKGGGSGGGNDGGGGDRGLNWLGQDIAHRCYPCCHFQHCQPLAACCVGVVGFGTLGSSKEGETAVLVVAKVVSNAVALFLIDHLKRDILNGTIRQIF